MPFPACWLAWKFGHPFWAIPHKCVCFCRSVVSDTLYHASIFAILCGCRQQSVLCVCSMSFYRACLNRDCYWFYACNRKCWNIIQTSISADPLVRVNFWPRILSFSHNLLMHAWKHCFWWPLKITWSESSIFCLMSVFKTSSTLHLLSCVDKSVSYVARIVEKALLLLSNLHNMVTIFKYVLLLFLLQLRLLCLSTRLSLPCFVVG